MAHKMVTYSQKDRDKAKATKARLFTVHASYPGGSGGVTYQGASGDIGQKVWDFVLDLIAKGKADTGELPAAEKDGER